MSTYVSAVTEELVTIGCHWDNRPEMKCGSDKTAVALRGQWGGGDEDVAPVWIPVCAEHDRRWDCDPDTGEVKFERYRLPRFEFTHDEETEMTARIAYHADESFYADGRYLLIRVTENEAGYEPVEGFLTVVDAAAAADRANVILGLSPKDVLDIRGSSMALGISRKDAEMQREDIQMQELGDDRGYATLAELITLIVRERQDLTAASAIAAAHAMPWDEAWDTIVGPALDQLTELLVAYGAVRTEG